MLEIEQLSHRYGKTEVLSDIHLEVAPGEIVCLLGASGSGKSTLLRIIAGLEPLQAGHIRFAGESLAAPGHDPSPQDRNFGLVFQDHVLFPHLSVAENVGFGLPELSAEARGRVVLEQLASVGLDELADRFPHTLSGGQQQRVALVRALAPRPRLMLMDEPFASVDSTRRRQLREDTRRALKGNGVAAILVTHDAEEAMEIGDRIALLDRGAIVQVGSPAEVWHAPASQFVAELFSGSDATPGVLKGGQVETVFGTVPAPASIAETAETQRACRVVFRSDSVTVAGANEGAVVLEDVRFLGDRYLLVIKAGDAHLRVTTTAPPDVAPGDGVTLGFDSDSMLVYLCE